MVQIDYMSENLVLETVQKGKGAPRPSSVHVARVCRSMNRNGDVRVTWKDLRFIDGAFTSWPKGWGLKMRTTAKVQRTIEDNLSRLDKGEIVDLRTPGTHALTGIL